MFREFLFKPWGPKSCALDLRSAYGLDCPKCRPDSGLIIFPMGSPSYLGNVGDGGVVENNISSDGAYKGNVDSGGNAEINMGSGDTIEGSVGNGCDVKGNISK
ncbi:unnamed protein product [Dovyalis caffra]|uniref:Uncharacterized protein n=1 Tax=Dovyalis caffra TaxID=77055 RepID=A0AAV1SA05_9ROSI|nr:unnamed protein product [Dovyalis caffra]